MTRLLASLALSAALLGTAGCYRDPAAPSGTLYSRAEDQRAYANNLLENPIEYEPVFATRESVYAKQPATSLILTSEETNGDEERLNITGDSHEFFFGAIRFTDY